MGTEFLGVKGEVVPTDMSRAGTLVFSLGRPDRGTCHLDAVSGHGGPPEILQTPAQEHHAMFSPDGHWLAYTSNAAGRQEIYVRPYRSFKGRNEGCQKVVAPGPYGRRTARHSTIAAATSIMVAPTALSPASCPAARGLALPSLSDSGSQATRPPLTSIPMASSS